jgi:hypothetical protein
MTREVRVSWGQILTSTEDFWGALVDRVMLKTPGIMRKLRRRIIQPHSGPHFSSTSFVGIMSLCRQVAWNQTVGDGFLGEQTPRQNPEQTRVS